MTDHNDTDEKRFAILIQWQRFADLFYDMKGEHDAANLLNALAAKKEFPGLYGYNLDGFAIDIDGPNRLCITVRTGQRAIDTVQVCRNYRQFGEPFWTLDGPWWDDLPALTEKWISALTAYRATMKAQAEQARAERHQSAFHGYLALRNGATATP